MELLSVQWRIQDKLIIFVILAKLIFNSKDSVNRVCQVEQKTQSVFLSCEVDGRQEGNLGDGRCIRFWIDSWNTDQPLKDLFPNLFILGKDKLITVYNRRSEDVRSTSFWTALQGSTQIAEKQQVMQLMQNVQLTDPKDSWKWLGDSSGCFSMQAFNFKKKPWIML